MAFVNLPPEIIDHVFQSCVSFTQVIGLASTCKQVHSIWKVHSSRIIWAVGRRDIRCFGDALMAVRATDIVLKSYQAGILPPALKMQQLSGNSQRPNLQELREVMNMQHLVRCIEYMFLNSTLDATTLFGWPMVRSTLRSKPISKAATEAWKDKFYRAAYRMLLAGAVLARPYMAPFFQAYREENIQFLQRCEHMEFSTSDIQHLRRSVVYDFDDVDESELGLWREAEYENIFGAFASFLVDDGRARAIRDGITVMYAMDWCTDVQSSEAVRELMCLLSAYEHLTCKFTHESSNSTVPEEVKNTRKVSVVHFGRFQVEEVHMPIALKETENVLLVSSPHSGLRHANGQMLFPTNVDVPRTINALQQRHSSSRYFDESGEVPETPPMFEFWHFALRHYLNLGFIPSTFWQWRAFYWRDIFGSGEAFTSSGCAPVERLPARMVSWHVRDED